ncbi:uroporphyrinogen-III C-methyltransferase [Fluviicola taffensis]|uniref:uroporphyrinogen-III C-methyltransferase n=1 Tax=Fluviicola taffensis (strain DSM 16823 / NCIMB 13979 / RW262) TaxID=755732 RepID=F2IHT0_FLUTR|nr:uroporphyrinogen-III C-methyltransferase [Fluviicola taffensis]AEA45889.1 uroporphyrinogen-III C-methyltransferase [Fluviicola taffensis DSM 16823]
MSTRENPTISLVGAGPGDVELISVKGLNRLKKAKVVLYDALVNEELLTYAPTAKKIFVGKRLGFKAYEQEQINQLMVDSAIEFGHVVRLKGGDSFVFGRGMEEILFAREHQIPTEVIPGISSSISVPALAEIPVTHRGISNSFLVLSATLADGSLNPELEKARELNATIVILMGIAQLPKIVELYQLANKGEIPVSIIYNGSLETQKEVFGTIDTIVAQNEQASASGPGVIVIGEVVSLASNYQAKVYSESSSSCCI